MVVPSKEVRSWSDGMPGTGAALVDCQPAGG